MNRCALCRFLVAIFALVSPLSADLLYVAFADNVPHGLTVLDATTFLPTSPIFEIVDSDNPQPSLAVNPDGTLVYLPTQSNDNLYAVNAGPPLTNFSGSPFSVSDVPRKVVSSSSLVYVAVQFGTFYVFDAHTLAPYMTSPYGLPYSIPTAMTINPAGTFVYLADSFLTNDLYKIDALTLAVSGPVALADTCHGLVVSADGTRLYATNDNGDVQEFDAMTLAAIGSPHPTGGTTAIGIVITPDGNRLFTTSSPDGLIAVLDAHTFAPIVAPFSSGGTTPTDIVINADGTRVYVLNTGTETISEIDAVNPALIGMPHDTGVIESVALAIFSPPTPPPPTNDVDPPTNFTGFQQKNDFGCAYELYNTLRWNPSPTSGVVGYNIYRDGSKIATLNASTLQYEDHNRKRGATTVYAIKAFTDLAESAAVNIAIQ